MSEDPGTIQFLNLFPTEVRAMEVSIGSKTKEAKLIHYLERGGISGRVTAVPLKSMHEHVLLRDALSPAKKERG